MFEVENEFDVGNKLEVEFAVELVDSSLERETKLIFFVSKIKLQLFFWLLIYSITIRHI